MEEAKPTPRGEGVSEEQRGAVNIDEETSIFGRDDLGHPYRDRPQEPK